MKKIVLLLSLVFLFSCKKNIDKEVWTPEIKKTEFSSAIDLMNSFKNDLKNLKSYSEYEKQIVFKKISSEVVSFVNYKYKMDVRKDLEYIPENYVLLGLFLAINEESQKPKSNEILGTIAPQPSEQMDCFMMAVGSIIGISEAKSLYTSLVSGGLVVETAVSAVKLIAKRVGVVLTVGLLVWDIGSCFNWW